MVNRPPQQPTLGVGQECLLNVIGRHFKVRVIELTPDTVRVTFPGRDYPADGMHAILELHDDTGFHYFSTEVLEGPRPDAQGILIRNVAEMRRSFHRDHVRIPTDLTVQVREQVHVRRYNAALLNLSAGGALIQTDAVFEFNSVVDLTLSLPSEPAATIMGEIVHTVDSPSDNRHMYGIRFLDVDAVVVESITRYIWRRLPELYPARHSV